MKIVRIQTTDKHVWNSVEVFSQITQFMCQGYCIKLDFLKEGPDVAILGIYDFVETLAKELNYPLSNIIVETSNALEHHDTIRVHYKPPIHLLDQSKAYCADIYKTRDFKHFGLFVGRSNLYRLHLATFLHKHHIDKTLLSYRFNLNDDIHLGNVGLERLIKEFNTLDVREESNFLNQCPFLLDTSNPVVIDRNIQLNHAQQLLAQDKNSFIENYRNFFVEVVCETYFTGRTFFTTEKIFRPILLKTPFIVQGPRYFLDNLKKLGFKTFDRWWNEAYSEDPSSCQHTEIKNTINFLASKDSNELHAMYIDMQDVLEHNYNLAMTLTANNFNKIYEQK